MIPIPDNKWECKKCGEKIIAHQNEGSHQFDEASPKCPKCGGEMMKSPLVHRGPFPENPFLKR